MSISTGRDGAIDGYEAVQTPSHAVAASRGPAMFRRRSIQPSRRAVLHVQADGDPAMPAGLASWCTERAFHFYLAGLRLPGRPGPVMGRGGRTADKRFGPAFADLDTACGELRRTDGMDHVIVMAQGRSALAVALWSDARRVAAGGPDGRGERRGAGGRIRAGVRIGVGGGVIAGGRVRPGAPVMEAACISDRECGDEDMQARSADALILYAPELPTTAALCLDIACPVLVLSAADSGPAASGRWRLRAGGAGAHLGRHVTWLRLPGSDGEPDVAGDADEHALFDELGRWLGAYMYRQMRDQLL